MVNNPKTLVPYFSYIDSGPINYGVLLRRSQIGPPISFQNTDEVGGITAFNQDENVSSSLLGSQNLVDDKKGIALLNVALSKLQILQNIEMAEGNYSEDGVVHSTAVFDDLESKPMRLPNCPWIVLTPRTENIKVHENRIHTFSTNASR